MCPTVLYIEGNNDPAHYCNVGDIKKSHYFDPKVLVSGNIVSGSTPFTVKVLPFKIAFADENGNSIGSEVEYKPGQQNSSAYYTGEKTDKEFHPAVLQTFTQDTPRQTVLCTKKGTPPPIMVSVEFRTLDDKVLHCSKNVIALAVKSYDDIWPDHKKYVLQTAFKDLNLPGKKANETVVVKAGPKPLVQFVEGTKVLHTMFEDEITSQEFNDIPYFKNQNTLTYTFKPANRGGIVFGAGQTLFPVACTLVEDTSKGFLEQHKYKLIIVALGVILVAVLLGFVWARKRAANVEEDEELERESQGSGDKDIEAAKPEPEANHD